MTQEDHDLLIAINTKLDRALADIAIMMTTKAPQVEVDDHEMRIRRLERWGFGAAGVIFVVQILIVIVRISSGH